MKLSITLSKVLLDPTCTLEQILNRAQYGMALPQRDVSGVITQEELSVLGISGNDLTTMSRMEMIDLRIKAQMRLQSLEAKRLKIKKQQEEELLKKGAVDEYIEKQRTNITT